MGSAARTSSPSAHHRLGLFCRLWASFSPRYSNQIGYRNVISGRPYENTHVARTPLRTQWAYESSVPHYVRSFQVLFNGGGFGHRGVTTTEEGGGVPASGPRPSSLSLGSSTAAGQTHRPIDCLLCGLQSAEASTVTLEAVDVNPLSADVCSAPVPRFAP